VHEKTQAMQVMPRFFDKAIGKTAKQDVQVINEQYLKN
jgi:hypothetical protein